MNSPLMLVVVFSFILFSSFHRDRSATPPVALIAAFAPSMSRAGHKVAATGPGFSPRAPGNTVRSGDVIPPVITGFTPALGRPGDTITITGTGFSPVAANNNILFAAGTTGTVLAATATQLKVRVPVGAVTGAISVTNGALTATSRPHFKILNDIPLNA